MEKWFDLIAHSFTSVFPVFLIFLTGYAFGKIFKKKAEMLSTLAFWLFGSILILTYVNEHLPKLDHIWRYFLGTIIIILIIIILYWIIGKITGKSFKLWAYTSIFSNTGYIGYPVLEYSVGPRAIPLAVIMASANMILLPTVGVLMLTGGKENKDGKIEFLKNAAKHMASVPWIYALATGWILGLLGFKLTRDLPGSIMNYVQMLKDSAIPVILLVVGVNLSKFKLKPGNLKRIFSASFSKLLIPPILAVFVGKMLGMQGLVYKVFVLELAMPTAVNTAILAQGVSEKENGSKEEEKDFASAVVVYSTFLFLFSFPIWYSFMAN